eukprot:7129134-Prymnesium_polylepis.1
MSTVAPGAAAPIGATSLRCTGRTGGPGFPSRAGARRPPAWAHAAEACAAALPGRRAVRSGARGACPRRAS